jgi:cation diffusion facilitator family transporter
MAGGKGDSVKTILYALGANFAIFVAKGVAAAITGSGAMLAEAVHSLADCGNQGLLLLGMKRAKMEPTPDYPLGYGKEIYFWSFLVALMLFMVGGGYSLYEGWHKLHSHEPLTYPWVAIGVLTFGIIAESVSMRACLVEVNKARGSHSLWQWFRESRQAELVVIFGEDLAALFGLVFALLAVIATMITGNPVWDAIGTLGIGVLLVVIAIFISVEIKAMLIGQSVDSNTREAIRSFIESRPEIGKVFNVITVQLGNDVMVAVQAAPADPGLPTAENIARTNAVEAAMRKQFADVRWCFFELDDSD